MNTAARPGSTITADATCWLPLVFHGGCAEMP